MSKDVIILSVPEAEQVKKLLATLTATQRSILESRGKEDEDGWVWFPAGNNWALVREVEDEDGDEEE